MATYHHYLDNLYSHNTSSQILYENAGPGPSRTSIYVEAHYSLPKDFYPPLLE